VAIRYSDASLAKITGNSGLRQLVEGSKILMFTGAQPANPNQSAGTAQPIVAFTDDNGVYSAEVSAKWQFTLSGVSGTAGITSMAIGGVEILGTTATNTTATSIVEDTATAVNANVSNQGYNASFSGDSLVITAAKGSGGTLNALSLVIATTGTVTTTYDDTAHTGAPSVIGVMSSNGLSFNVGADGSSLSPSFDGFFLQKKTGQTWKGRNGYDSSNTLFSGITTGTSYSAGWGRICMSVNDTGLDATTGIDGYARIDFSVGSANADCIMLPAPSFFVETATGQEIESLINSFILKINRRMS